MRETDYQLVGLEPRILLSADWNGVFDAVESLPSSFGFDSTVDAV